MRKPLYLDAVRAAVAGIELDFIAFVVKEDKIEAKE